MFSGGERSRAEIPLDQRCYPGTAIVHGPPCPGFEDCSASFDAISITSGANCGGCGLLGIGTLTCDGAVILSVPLALAGACEGDTQAFPIPCPNGTLYGGLLFTCSECG